MKISLSMCKSFSSDSFGEFPGAGMKTNSVLDFSFFDFFPVCIVSPNRLKCLSNKMIVLLAVSRVSVINAASST